MPEQFRRRHLPHWDVPGGTYFVTTCLAGSIPASGLLAIDEYRESLERRRSSAPGMSQSEWSARSWKLTFARVDQWLDGALAVKHFHHPSLAQVACQSIQHFDEVRYDTLAFVVTPSHVHWLFQPRASWAAALPEGVSPRESIMHSFKSFTATECNRMLHQKGTFWQAESYDHWVRDDDELERIVDYIELNPVQAGLCTRREE